MAAATTMPADARGTCAAVTPVRVAVVTTTARANRVGAAVGAEAVAAVGERAVAAAAVVTGSAAAVATGAISATVT
jgi:hypothetical protein